MKESKQIATEITKAMIEKLTTVGDVFTLKNENYALKEELNELKRRKQAQGREIESLRKLVTTLEREVRSLKEGIGPLPAVKKVSKKPSPLSKRTEERKNSSSLSLQQDMQHNDMDVEPLSTPGCSADQDYMNRDTNRGTDWPRGRDTTSWNLKTNDTDTNKNTNIANIKSKIHMTNIYTSSKSNIITSTNINTNERNSTVKTIEPVRSSNKRIKVLENVQLVPPSRPQLDDTEWVRVEKKARRTQISTPNSTSSGHRQRFIDNKNGAPKPSKRAY